MTTTAEIMRYTAFSSDPDGGNPAGVVLDAAGLQDADMLAIAADLGFSESAFLTAPPEHLDAPPGRGFTIRFFSPKAEVPFCGHATVATSIALGERIGTGELVFATRAGTVPVRVEQSPAGLRATLTTVQLVWRESDSVFHVRDPFPVGGVVEDSATGAAAGAFGAYAREIGLLPSAAVLTLHQGEDMGRPGELTVELREGDPRVHVSGVAAQIV